MKPGFKVFGHPRSGNHMLAAMLRRAFFSDVDLGATYRNAGTGHWSQRAGAAPYLKDGVEVSGDIEMPYARLLGDHCFPAESRYEGRFLYIVRDGRDVALSMYAWPKMRPVQHRSMSFAHYLRTPIDWRGSPGARHRGGRTLWAHWRDHVAQWLDHADLVTRYEDLVLHPARELARIGSWLGRAPNPTDTGEPVGWNPSPPAKRVSRWRGRMDADDVHLFDWIVPPEFPGRFEETGR